MRKLIISLILLVFVGLNAQLLWENDVPVRQSVNIEWGRASVPTPDGCVVYVWSDVRRGDRDIYAQKVDGDGNSLWGEMSDNSNFPDMKEGILINGGADRQEDIVIIETGDGQTIVAWVDFRNDFIEGDIYLQKIDENGNLLWNVEGVPACTAEGVQISLNIVSDENGGAYIIWLDGRFQTGPDIFGTHVLADGTFAEGWIENGNSIVTEVNSQAQHTFWEDGDGGAVVAWYDERNSGNVNLYMQRIAPNGDLLWAENGSVLCGAAGEQVKPKVTRINDGSFIFAWRDKRSDSNGDIYGQHVDLDGNLLWSEDKVFCEGVGIQRNPRIQDTSDGNAVVVWEDGTQEVDDGFMNLHAQKITPAGDLLWDVAGVAFCEAPFSQINPRTAKGDDGGIWLTWDDFRDEDFPNVDIFVQHLDVDGNALLETDGKQVCFQFSEQFSPLIKHSGDKIFVIWGNGNNETGARTMNVQILNEDGTDVLPENGNVIYGGICGNASQFIFLENGENPIVLWEDSRDSHIANQNYFQIFNADGTFQFEDNGLAITEMTSINQENLDGIYNAETSKIAAVWTEGRIEGIAYAYAQLLDSNGNRLWGEQGLEICDNNQAQEYTHISEYNGDYYIAWGDMRTGIDFGVSMQKVNAAGEIQWGTEGIEIVDLISEDEISAVVENYVIWENAASWNDINIHVAKVDEDGNMAAGWPDEGLVVCAASDLQKDAKAKMTDQGLLIIWQDQRDGTADLYGQIVTSDGGILWEEDGAPLVISPQDQVGANFIYDDGIYLAWDDNQAGNYDVYMQKFNGSAEEQWTSGGLEILVATDNQQSPYIVSNGDSFLYFWEDYIGGEEVGASESNIKAQSVSASGSKEWNLNGEMISNAIKDQKFPVAVFSGDNEAFVLWEDARSSGKNDIYNIYAQRVDFGFVASTDEDLELGKALCQNYPNPFNPTTTIKFSVLDNLQNTDVSIYNIKGQKISTLVNNKMDIGTHSIVWNGTDSNNKKVTSGVYFYKLSNGEIFETGKMVLMK